MTLEIMAEQSTTIRSHWRRSRTTTECGDGAGGRIILKEHFFRLPTTSQQRLPLRLRSADAYSGRGLARARLLQYEEGVRDANKSLELGKKNWKITLNAARTFAQAALAAESVSRQTGPVASRTVSNHLDRATDLVKRALERCRRISERKSSAAPLLTTACFCRFASGLLRLKHLESTGGGAPGFPGPKHRK